MADYQGLIRVGVQGLGEIRQLNTALERANELFGNLENAQIIAGQIGESATRNLNRAAQRRAQAGRDLARANQIVENTAQRRDPRTGRFLPGGPNATARRLAGRNERLAQREVLQSDRALREEIRNQRLVSAAQRRYAGALNRTANAIDGLQGQLGEEQARLEAALAGIARGSRGNYLTNLFQGRQAALARGGGGRNLAPNLQEQIRANRSAWDLATAGGRENLQLMSKLATELAGLVRQQNEFNRRRALRSGTFETARRGQERITALSEMPGADPAKIRRLRSQATRAGDAGFRGDAAETQLETRRMNASIARYERELRAAARELQIARARGGPRSPIRGGVNVQGSPAYIERMARIGGARESIKGRKDLPGSPAYIEEQQRQLARAIRAGGAREGIKGRKDLPGSPAYIEEQKKQLQRAIRAGGPRESIKGRKDVVGSPAYLEEQRKQQAQQLQRAIRAGGPRESVKGRKELPGSPAYIEEQQRQLARAIRAGGPRESIKGRKDVVGSPAYYEEQQRQLQRAIRAGGPRESIKGRKDLPGSPAYIEEQRKQQAEQLKKAVRMGGPRESVRGRKDIPGSPAYLEEQQRRQERVARMRQISSPIRGTINMPGSPAYLEEQARLQRQGIAGADKGERFRTVAARQSAAVAKREDELARLGQQGINTARLQAQLDKARIAAGDGSVKAQERFKRSIIELDTSIRRLSRGAGGGAGAARPQGLFRGDARKAIGEGLIGGAFPLLFGQGLGASVGGAVGGGLGGAIGGSFGFGLSLAGTAIGQAVDTTAANLKELASALKSPADAITALETSGFRVGDSLKLQVQQLQSVGRAYDAQTIVLQEVQKRLGPGSLTELRQLDAAQKKLQEQYAAIAAEIQVRLLPVLQGFVEFLGIAAGDIGGFASQSRLQRLDPAKFEELRSQAIRESSGFAFNIAGVQLGFNGSNQKKEARLSELSKQELSRRFANERAQVPLSAEQKLEGEITRLNESRKIADQIQSAYREAFNLQRQAHDLQRDGADLNREIADYSYRKEREIFDLKQQAAEKQIENNRAAAQNRIERGDLDARQTFAAAVGFEQQLLTNVREVMRTRMEGEADIEQSRSKLELAMARLNRDVEDYKRTNAREVEDIERRKLAYARSVEDYKMRVADYVLQRSRESADLMRQAMTLPSMDGGGANNGVGSARGYFARLAELESSSGKNWTNPTSNARGFFQLIPKTEQWLKSVGKGDLAARLLSRDFETASEAAKQFAIVMRPAAKGLIEAGDIKGLDRLLNRVWTSLPGGAEAATGQRLARANALLAPSATVGGNAMFGRTGNMRLREGYGMVDLRGSSREAIIADAADAIVNRASAGMRTWIGGGGGLDIEATNLRGQELIAALQRGMKAHETRPSTPATAIDLIAKLGEPLGIPVAGISNRGGATGIAGTTSRGTLALHLAPGSTGAAGLQGAAAGQISSIAPPQFNPAPIGATPSAAPANAARMAVAAVMGGNEQQAQQILEDQNKLKLKGVELGQIEQILQANQLPQLQQQEQALRLQIEARRKNLGLSDDAAAAVDMEAEGVARVKQIEAERAAALSKVQKQYGNDLALVKQVNEQADLGVKIAKEEERQRRTNLGLNNELQNAERVRSEILQLQEVLAAGRVEAAALERGELQATAVELLKASSLYQQAGQAQKDKLIALVAETEELKKQNEFKRRINELDQDIRFAGAGLRAGFVGAPARAFEQGLKDFDGDMGKATQLANRTRLLEDEQAAWSNLERNIVDVSNAISGGLTNGLVDIVGGARKIEDVGRDMLNSIARSFATSAEQQLTALMQRQLGSLLGGAQGPLVKMLGAGGEVAGSQALGAASVAASSSLWGVSSAAAAAGVALQTIAAQAAFSGGLGSLGGIGQIFSGAAPNLFSKAIPDFIPSLAFGGFLANGGTTRPGEGYVVGENEPEFFFPGVSGRVVPRSDMQKAEELRQGSEQSEPIDLRYTVTEQRGERYVTEQQFREGMERTSRRAQAMTYAGMRNNKEVRSFVDI